MPASRVVAHKVNFIWTPETTASTALTANVGIEGRVVGIETTGLWWGKQDVKHSLQKMAASACSASTVTLYSSLSTKLLSTTYIPSADPMGAPPCACFWGSDVSSVATADSKYKLAFIQGAVFVTKDSYLFYAAGGNYGCATDNGKERVVSGTGVYDDELPRATVILYVEQ